MCGMVLVIISGERVCYRHLEFKDTAKCLTTQRTNSSRQELTLVLLLRYHVWYHPLDSEYGILAAIETFYLPRWMIFESMMFVIVWAAVIWTKKYEIFFSASVFMMLGRYYNLYQDKHYQSISWVQVAYGLRSWGNRYNTLTHITGKSSHKLVAFWSSPRILRGPTQCHK